MTPPLETLYVYLTAGCNLACGHCWLSPRRDPDGSAEPVLPLEVFEGVVREARPLGLVGVKLTGGEPLLHPRIAEILEIVRHEGLALSMETNGVLLTPELAGAIAAIPERAVSVSIDGADAATHDRARGVPGAFEGACRAVRLLAGTGTPPEVIMTLTRRNAGQVEAVVGLAESLGARAVKVNVIQPAGRGAVLHGRGEVLGVTELVELGGRLVREVVPRTPLRLILDLPAAFRPLSRIAEGADAGTCRILNILGVLPGGEYALCGVGTMAPELVFGRAGVDSLERVWRESPVLRELREGLPDRLEGVCGRCLMRHLCRGSCIAQNWLSSGSLWAPHWFCAEAECAGVFPETRLEGEGGADSVHQFERKTVYLS